MLFSVRQMGNNYHCVVLDQCRDFRAAAVEQSERMHTGMNFILLCIHFFLFFLSGAYLTKRRLLLYLHSS